MYKEKLIIELAEDQLEFITRALRVLSVEVVDTDPTQANQIHETRLYLQQIIDDDMTPA
tara:strand:- start:221 stop:397 length:177 start_codon:yes stop_codon:yes gene_type:complete